MTSVSPAGLSAIAGAGAAAVLLGALGFQYIGGLPPCELCLYQRVPYAVVVLLGVVGVIMSKGRSKAGIVIVLWLMVPAILASAGLGLFHWGVEQGWWIFESGCTVGSSPAGDGQELTVEDLRAAIMAAPVVRCDEALWSFLGLSMAGWNMLISIVAGIGLIRLLLWRRT